ncbi:hypothetical protein OEW28_13220 [Defluviimonas sp. WL0002]|uniref:Cytochrome-c oxidase n=1 Tax=Albidovulum marisflavi TaxID=2984159 RepID=A0ABT2ZER8_9RHOB|nr:hypothetical protein [Defluviimonas sp. WL0002]MCV2869590.1 hypothetical protein [Defluviimonas sp. WL0002]
MNISKAFLVIAVLYLLVGIAIGMHMGASGDHTLSAAHAHINLLGFTLMTIFGLAYRVIPAMADSILAKAHFWLHQIGAFILLVMLVLLLSGSITEAAMFPLAPLAELAIWVGAAVFGLNVLKNA